MLEVARSDGMQGKLTRAAAPADALHRLPLPNWQTTASLRATAAEQELLSSVEALGRYPTALFPGDEAGRAGIDAAIAALEAATPTPAPLRSPLLLGEWQLVYASSGTYVTRTAAAQALLAASALPGVGVGDIRQALQLPPADDAGSSGEASSSGSGSGSGDSPRRRLRTSNAAMLGLGPLGDWEVVINGDWRIESDTLARVVFDGFSLQLVGLLGVIKLPRMAKVCVLRCWKGAREVLQLERCCWGRCVLHALRFTRRRPSTPTAASVQVSVPVPNGRSADFSTTYLSDALRVARGASGNIFVFSRAS